jgi:hypothetical protein
MSYPPGLPGMSLNGSFPGNTSSWENISLHGQNISWSLVFLLTWDIELCVIGKFSGRFFWELNSNRRARASYRGYVPSSHCFFTFAIKYYASLISLCGWIWLHHITAAALPSPGHVGSPVMLGLHAASHQNQLSSSLSIPSALCAPSALSALPKFTMLLAYRA